MLEAAAPRARGCNLVCLRLQHRLKPWGQAGCGESSRDAAERPSEDTPWLFTVDYYVDEL